MSIKKTGFLFQYNVQVSNHKTLTYFQVEIFSRMKDILTLSVSSFNVLITCTFSPVYLVWFTFLLLWWTRDGPGGQLWSDSPVSRRFHRQVSSITGKQADTLNDISFLTLKDMCIIKRHFLNYMYSFMSSFVTSKFFQRVINNSWRAVTSSYLGKPLVRHGVMFFPGMNQEFNFKKKHQPCIHSSVPLTFSQCFPYDTVWRKARLWALDASFRPTLHSGPTERSKDTGKTPSVSRALWNCLFIGFCVA